jgi:hypothetical protein
MVARLVATAVVLVALALTGMDVLAGTPSVAAASAPTSVVDRPSRPETECISANPRPDCYQSSEFERSSRSHLILFGVLGVGLAVIAVVVARSVLRTDRAHKTRTTS